MILLTWGFSMFLTFVNGTHATQDYRGFPTEEQCKIKLDERMAWLEGQHRDGLMKGSAVVVCHEESS